MTVLKYAALASLLCAPVMLSGCASEESVAQSGPSHTVKHPRFASSGEVYAPDGYREWVYVGTPLTPNGLNGGQAAFPEYHNVYIEPTAYAQYRRTGAFPEGTQMVKELVLIRESEDGNFPDGSAMQSSGRGYFPGEFNGLELAYKNTEKYPDEPGGWVYFTFGHHAPPYAQTAAAMPTEACNSCHETNAAQDYVFTQYYPVLRAASR